jgi:Tol biopolymer transport system component
MAGGKLLTLSVAFALCAPLLLDAQKGPKPPKPGGGSSTAVIAYEAQNRSGGWDLMLMDANGGNEVRLVTGGHNRTPSWSPDGEWIAFSRTSIADPGIYMVRRDGTGLCKVVSTDAWPFGAPAWSPAKIGDTYKIVFVQRPGGTGNTDVYVTNGVCGAGSAQQLTHTPTYLESAPAWSTNDVLAVGADADGIHLYDVTVDEFGTVGLSAAFNLTATSPLAGYVVNSPAWNADGSALIITAASQSLFDLWMIPVDDPNGAQQLTNTPGVSEGRVTWSPDFSQLAYDAHQSAIYRVAVQTTPTWSLGAPTVLANVKGGTFALVRPSWRPVP